MLPVPASNALHAIYCRACYCNLSSKPTAGGKAARKRAGVQNDEADTEADERQGCEADDEDNDKGGAAADGEFRAPPRRVAPVLQRGAALSEPLLNAARAHASDGTNI